MKGKRSRLGTEVMGIRSVVVHHFFRVEGRRVALAVIATPLLSFSAEQKKMDALLLPRPQATELTPGSLPPISPRIFYEGFSPIQRINQ